MDVNALLFSPKSVIDVQHGVGGSTANDRSLYTRRFDLPLFGTC